VGKSAQVALRKQLYWPKGQGRNPLEPLVGLCLHQACNVKIRKHLQKRKQGPPFEAQGKPHCKCIPPSERTKEFEERFLFAGFEPFKLFGYLPGFAAVAENGIEKRGGGAIVHKP